MAGNVSPDNKRKSVTVPFADGIQDPRLGLAENVLLYDQKDTFNGEFKYFTLRPNIVSDSVITDAILGSIGSPKDVSQYEPNLNTYVVLATSENIYFVTPNGPYTATPVLTGGDIITYKASMGFTPRLIKYQNVATVGNSFLFCADVLANQIYDIHDSVTYSAIPLGFSPCTYAVSMDGYVFISEHNGDTIYNSDLNDITTWNIAVNNLRATQYTGAIRALGRQNNYILAFKENSIEYFYNAGLTNTSPLQRQTSYTKKIGLSYTNSLAQFGDTFYFVGQAAGEQENAIYKLTATSIDKVSTPEVDRYLLQFLNSSPDTSAVFAYCTKIDNKEMYVLSNIGDSSPSSTRNFTLVYDASTSTWSSWTYSSTNTFPIVCATTFSFRGMLYFADSLHTPLNTAGTCQIRLGVANDIFGSSSTKDYFLSDYTPIISTVKIPSFDFGTGNRKFMHEMSLSVIAPDTMMHDVTLVKTVGYGRQTVTKNTTNGDNLNFKNWGQFVSAYVTYSLYDPSNTSTPGMNSSTVRINSINMEVSQGIS